MKWMISEDRLGTDQREVINELSMISDKPIWIQGYAGSGKSVLLLHSLKDYLARNPKANVCVVVFTRALVDLLSTGLKQIPFLEKKEVPVITIYRLMKEVGGNTEFDAIFCDEVQDLPSEVIEKMKKSCKHLIIAGDAAQSIYTRVPGFNTRPASSKEIVSLINPIEKSLKVIYRLTQSVIAMLKNVFPEMLGERPVIGKADTEIKLYKAESSREEVEYCWDNAKETNSLRHGEMVVVLLNSQKSIIAFVQAILKYEGKVEWVEEWISGIPNYRKLNSYLNMNGIPLMYVGNGYGSLVEADRQEKIIIMTYHSSKGLDFDYVYLPWVSDQMKIHFNVPVNALLLVALSRSKSGLTITFSGNLHPNLKPFLQNIEVRPLPNGDEEEAPLF